MAGAKHTIVFNVSKEQLWEVISDYEGYAEFVEGVESIEITKREGNQIWADYVVSMFGKKVHYTLKHTETPMKQLVWEMTEGEMFKFNNGGWDLKEKGADKVEATYTVDVGLPLLVPKAIVNTLTGTQLPSMMKAFEDRAKSLASKPKKALKSGAKGKKK
jgi:coenzyme Q-binding protein COQ10